jgi:DnaJ family protein C protein 16
MEHALAALFLLLLLSWLAVKGDARRDESLYDVLGVSRKANQKEIRSAYKKLAREWHPDKNKSPRAQEKILEINKAYEALSTEESRRHYDMTGETDSAPSTSQGHTHNHGFTFFQTGNGQFQFHFTGGGGFGHTHHPRKDTITTHYFRSTVLPESGVKLFLLNFFSDFCMQCSEVARVWDELREELISHGVGMASVHASFHHAISSHCGVDRVPAIVAVVDKRAFHYRGPLQARSIRNFVKGTLPSWIISELNSRNIDDFISDSIKLNKPRIILFSPHPQPSLLYKSVAFLNHHSIDFGFVSTDRASGNSLEFLQRFGVYSRAKKLFVFKEYPTPSVTVEESQLSSDSLKSVVRGTRLHLPRLSSPKVMEDTCSNEGRLCLVLLVSGPASYNDSITDAFRASAMTVSSAEGGGYFSVGYMDEEKQRMFVSSLERAQETVNHCPSGEKARSVSLTFTLCVDTL